jgi:2-polyprenyl-6-methoxyphenol hydroxylase-like FAD-dependent oxidoreductase
VTVPFADFRRLPTRCRFIAFIPQWEFLDFLAERARRYPSFRLRMQAEARELIEDADRIVGLRASTPAGPLEVRAGLVVGADGRHSTVRAAAGLAAKRFGVPIDVLWFRLTRGGGDPEHSTGVFDAGAALVLINRRDYWQCGYVIPKGSFERLSAAGIDRFRRHIGAMAPFLADRVGELADWHDISLLSVSVDRLVRWWRPGLLCLGDAAHAMSPIGGVGINLAIQDAVAAANELAARLRDRRVDDATLRRVQSRRTWPTSATQRAQVFVQERVLVRVLRSERGLAVPLPLRLLRRFPALRRLTGRLVGMGLRPEHVRSPDAHLRGS